MAPWSCQTCTFINKDGNASHCEMCQSNRRMGLKEKSLKPAAKQRQTTLFGTMAAASSNGQKKEKAPTKTKAAASSKETIQPLLSMESKMGSSSLLAPIKTRQDVPYAELKERAELLMQQVFGISKLRGLQPQAIECALNRKNQLLVMATGGGKSLCYQLPALVLGGTTIVVSPLKALIADQVQALLKLKISAAFISSQLTEGQRLDVMERLLQRSLRAKPKTSSKQGPRVWTPISLLYVTPEQIQTQRFRDALKELDGQKRLTSFAIDEAHCISQWGHDFRKAYLQLGYLRHTFPNLPLMACTATATRSVLKDITESLHLQGHPCHVGTFNRPNVTYQVRYKEGLEITNPTGGVIGDLTAFIQSQHQVDKTKAGDNNTAEKEDSGTLMCNGIVYVHQKKETEEIAKVITRETGIKAIAYHGGMKDKDRVEIQKAWMSGDAPIAVATIAFGMGIDLAHVRYVVHWNISKSIEAFYQESGRAGRDGLPSISLVYYSREEMSLFQFLANKHTSRSEQGLAALEKMNEYCMVPGCRRKYLLNFFGESKNDPKTVCRKSCDFCKNREQVTLAIEAASACREFSFQLSSLSPAEWDGQHDMPYGDDEENDDDRGELASNGLLIRGGSSQAGLKLPGDSKKRKSVEEVLKKYEAVECNENQTGFVKFRSRVAAGESDDEEESEKRHRHVVIPEHLRKDAPDPLQHFNKVALESEPLKSSTDLAADASRLKEELAKLQAAKAALLSRNKQSSSRAAPPPPPPPAVMGLSKKQRRK